MASPSMPDPRCHFGAHDCDTDQESYYACSIASSNETVDDIAGAGRTLGKLYSVAGRFLERRLGRVAEKMGYGPRATVVGIHRQRLITASKHVESESYCTASSVYEARYWRRSIDELDQILRNGTSRLHDMNEDHYRFLRKFSSGLPSSSKEKDNVKKYCKRLLRYVRSNVESTKRQALDYIIELAIEDEYIRELFSGVKAVNVIESLRSNPALWVNCGASLQRSSRRAVLVLGDVEVHTLALKIKHYEKNRDSNGQVVCFEALAAYLQDPNYSFVAVRYLRQSSSMFLTSVMDTLADGIAKAINAYCDNVEFEECDHILEIWVSWSFGCRYQVLDECSAVMEVILRYAEKLPRTVSSRMFQNWVLELETGNAITQEMLRAHYIMAVLLNGIADANRSGDEDLRVTYSYEPLLQLLESPPDLALSEFAFLEYEQWMRRVPGAENLRRVCDKLTTSAISENSQIQERTWHCAKVLLTADIYCRTAILKALSLAHICYSTDLKSFIEETKMQSRSFFPASKVLSSFRHCDAKGRLLHIANLYQKRCDSTRGCVMDHVMRFEEKHVLILRLGRGTAFSSAGHYPVFAGHTMNGERAYLARAYFSHDYESVDCFVTEGTKPEDLRIRTMIWSCDPLEERTPISVDVYVLHWAPDMYPENEDNFNLGLDATGPLSWYPHEPSYYRPSRLPRTEAYISELDTNSEMEITFAEVASTDEEMDLSEEDV